VTETVKLLCGALEPMTRALRNREPTDAPEAESRIKVAMRPADSPVRVQ
jgi:hypothetical protein